MVSKSPKVLLWDPPSKWPFVSWPYRYKRVLVTPLTSPGMIPASRQCFQSTYPTFNKPHPYRNIFFFEEYLKGLNESFTRSQYSSKIAFQLTFFGGEAFKLLIFGWKLAVTVNESMVMNKNPTKITNMVVPTLDSNMLEV